MTEATAPDPLAIRSHDRDVLVYGLFRVLITASREYRNRALVYLALDYAFCETRRLGKTMILVHGECRKGGDLYADDWAISMMTLGFLDYDKQVEKHPADWNRYKKAAGFRRNAEMVNLGADVCLAFIRNNSNGASHTAGLAEKAGILTHRYKE